MIDPFGEKRGRFIYASLLSRLTEIYDRLLSEQEEEEGDGEEGADEEEATLKTGGVDKWYDSTI